MEPVTEKISRIKSLAETALLELGNDALHQKIKVELKEMKSLDVDVFREMKEAGNRDELVVHCRTVFADVKHAIKELPNPYRLQQVRQFLEEVITLENESLAKEVKIERLEESLRNEFIEMLDSPSFSEERCEDFLRKIKGVVSARAFKTLRREFEKKIEEPEPDRTPGPVYRSKDLEYLKQKFRHFFASPFGDAFPKDEKIRLFLFGSLVNGFCNNPSKAHYGHPSDEGRVSDVDVLVVISKEFFKDLFFRHPEATVSIHGTTRTFPIGLDTHFRPDKYAGPFKEIFHDFGHIWFAGSEKRPVHLVFVEKEFFLEQKLDKEPHIHITDIAT